MLAAACAHGSAREPLTIEQLPFPFSELAGVELGMSSVALIRTRPLANDHGDEGISETVGGVRVSYWTDGRYGPDMEYERGNLTAVVTGLPDTSMHRRAADRFVAALMRRPRACYRMVYGDTLLVLKGSRHGDRELVVAVVPTTIVQHRRGVDTMPSQLVMRWRKWGESTPFERQVDCAADGTGP